MTIRLEDEYPGRAQIASANYPDGAFKNESTEGANDGTPLEITWANDKEALFQGLLKAYGRLPNGNVDTVPSSQLLEALLSISYGQTRPRGMSPASLCAGLHLDDNAAFPNNSPHRSAYFASDPRGICVAWDFDLDRPMLLIVNAAGELRSVSCWDYSAAPALSSAWTVSLSSPNYHSIACDGESVFIAYDTGGNTWVAKFDLYPWTGTPVWTTDTTRQSPPYDHLIIANDERIALLLTEQSGPTDWQLAILVKSSGAGYLGKGNAGGTLEVDSEKARLTSNGTHIFWPCRVGSNKYLCSAKISDPTTSDYSAPTTTLGGEFTDVAALNADTVAVVSEATAAAESRLYAFHLGIGEFAFVGNLEAPMSNDPGDTFYPKLCFDGLNLNMTHAVRGDEGGDKTTVIRRVNATRFSRHMDMMTNIAAPMTSIGSTNVSGNDTERQYLVFDGRDVWSLYHDATNFSLFRVLAPGLRGI